jgi:glutathione-specific gamma-glutamylcyclotransferase
VYRIEKAYVDEVKAYLDHREINGYSVHYLPVYASEKDLIPVVEKATVYIGREDNPAYVGPMDTIDALAEHIFRSRGPSGENREYIVGLRFVLMLGICINWPRR